jgi:PAS domain S-box-containing protein
MTDTPAEEKRHKEIEILNRAFASFNEVTRQLQSSYEKLERRVQTLNEELALKNAELEQNLREKEEVKNHLHNILESLSTGVIVADRERRISSLNREAETILGAGAVPCIGKPLAEAFGPDLFDGLISKMERSENRNLIVERDYLSGDRLLNLQITVSPALDGAGQRIGTVLVLQDTTRLKRLEEEAERNKRLRAMGEMAAGIAHEIRNPLGSIELCASLLKKDLENDEDKRQLADNICSGVKNMDRIISSLLLFAQSPKPSRQKCAINALMDELLDFSAQLVQPEKIRFVREWGPEPMVGNADGELLKQVFLNLIRNSLQAMPGGGTLSLATSETVAASQGLQNGDGRRTFITITVSDTGEGIAKEHLANIFNPFFTTKERGTGLGLAIVHNIIKAHQGTIDVESGPGRGTTFTVKIPGWDETDDDGQA